LVAEDCTHAKTISCVVAVSPRMLRSEGTEDWKLITAGIDGLVRVYEARTLKCLHGMKYSAPISALAMSVDGNHLVIGTSEGSIDIRTRLNVQVESTSKKTHRGGTMKFFMRGVKSAPDPDDYAIISDKRRKLRKHEYALKQYRYGDALDDALTTRDPKAVSALLEELTKRRGLEAAISNRDEETLEPILAFTSRYIATVKYTPLLIGVAHTLCDIYSDVIGQSAVIDELFQKLRQQVSTEVENQKELAKVVGIIDMVLYSAERE